MPGSNKGKTALVLLHGFCEDKTLWDHIIPKLKFEGKIISPNLPGFGNTKLTSTKFNLTDIATYIYSDLTISGVAKCICIGHSLGGYITLALKNKYPDFITSIGLLHSTSLIDTQEKKNIRNKLVEFLNEHSAASFLSTFAPSLFSEVNINRLKPDIEKVINMSINIENKTIQAYAIAMRDRKEYSQLLYLENKSLFIAGKNDNAIPVEDSEYQIAHINNQENCYILENVAHMGMYESPSFIIKAINQFTTNNQ